MNRIGYLSTSLLICCTSANAQSAQADTPRLGMHIASAHLPARSGQNDLNPGLYLKLQSGVTGGFFYNSLRRWSVYVGYTVEYGPFALTVGVVSGYQKRIGPDGYVYGVSNARLAPMFSPSVALPFKVGNLTPRVSLIPGIGNSSTVVHISLETAIGGPTP